MGDGMGDGSRGPLHGLRVVDASTGTAGPVAAMLLADLGADVVVVPPPADTVRDDDDPRAAVSQRGKRVGAIPEGRVDVVVSHGPDVGFDLPETAVHLQVPAFLPDVGWPADVESDALAS